MKPNYALNKRNHRKYVQDFVDCDYISQLSVQEKAWLNLFLQEYYMNSFKETRLHSDEQKRLIGRINYERRHDTYAIKKCCGRLDSIEDKQVT